MEWAVALAVLARLASLAAIAWSWRNGALLNWGDAVAHLHIARRVFDCHQPRLSQLGSVWLPLPHILLIPFVQVYSWWANGIAGVIPSALAYVAACAGIYRLARRWLQPAAAALALAFFALNPNLLYLQTTAMTEPLFVCEMIWIVVWLVEWRTCLDEDPVHAGRLLGWIAAALVAAIFTRYDGWVMALIAWITIGVELLRRGRLRSRAFWLASALVVAAPIAWFVYNAAAFGDWLEFARGPYSAKAIELRTASHGAGPPHPGWHNPWVSLLFFLKVSEMDAVAQPGATRCWRLSVLGTAWRVALRTPPRLHLGAAAVAAGSFLRVFGGLWFGADLPSVLVAALLVQHRATEWSCCPRSRWAWALSRASPSPPCASSSRNGQSMPRASCLRLWL